MALFGWLGGNTRNCKELVAKVDALYRTQAVIEFEPDGTVIEANQNFLDVMDYDRSDVIGRHHRMFVETSCANSGEYEKFWESLRLGQSQFAEYKRVGNRGKEVWIQGAYSPLVDERGKVYKVVKFATDITERKFAEQRNLENANYASALKLCRANVMLADNDFNIVYMNDTVTDMLKSRESELQQTLKDFRVDQLIGKCVDAFHVTPSHQRNHIKNLTESFKSTIKVSGLTFELFASPWMDVSGVRIGTLVEWQDKTDELAKNEAEKKAADENLRVRQALDACDTRVMIADQNASIVYMNSAVAGMMKNAETDIRRALPNFNADRLMGVNMDVFHKDPSHQRNLLQNIKGTYNGNVDVGGRTFSVIASPVYQKGERIGTVVEWNDRTAEVAIEREVDHMIKAASDGDFTKQISLEGKAGFLANLSCGLNELVGTVEVATNDIMRMLGAMARGDLSERITRDYLGAFGQLKTDANLTADTLTEIIGKIRSSSGAILAAANEISQGNADLSQRTEEQASSLEETASSMEEMTSTVKQSAENAEKANQLSLQAQNKAKQGGLVVSKAVEAMAEINHSSKKISDIIGVIDEIAFQTNLLALNAAVEAARAGEQGRGFAVVAGEVRNLAQRSAGAAKEIKALIRDSVSKVQDGRELVNASGQTLEDIVAAVENVSNMMRDITEAAREQTTGIEQVNTAVSQMDEMTQQNAALVEQASSAGEALAEQANSMNSVVEFFSVVQDNMPHSRAHNPMAKPRPSAKRAVMSPVIKTAGKAKPSAYDDEEWEEF